MRPPAISWKASSRPTSTTPRSIRSTATCSRTMASSPCHVASATRPARSRGKAPIGATPARSSWSRVSISEYNLSAK